MSVKSEQQPVWYRHAPYLLFFPLGGLLSLLGILPWGLFALRVPGSWQPTLHAMTEIQSALTCFAVGFLFTFVPRRTGTAPPSHVEVFASLALLFVTPLAALFGFQAIGHLAWAFLALLLCAFAGSRIRPALKSGAAVAQLLWLPVSFGMAFVGALFAAAAGRGPSWMPGMGTSMIWQGLLAGLVVGIGGMLLPMLLHREVYRGDTSRRAWLFHSIAAALFVASFVIEPLVGMRWGYALRALVTFGMLLIAARLWRWPQARGFHRRVSWFAAWMIPLGFALVAMFPAYRVGFLHLTFLSGFAAITLAVANHVAIAHGGRDPLLFANPRPLIAMGAAIVAATGARLLIAFDASRMQLWAGVAFSCFAVALISWAVWVFPRLKSAPKDGTVQIKLPTGARPTA